jgi:Fungal specific transcription factor domain
MRKNLCVRRYLTCFNPIFPIIHAATFQRTSDNGLLLISMASVGCLFLGSQAAVQRGRRIFETLNKVILNSVSSTFSVWTWSNLTLSGIE